jgi:HK97 family phage major capsid protein
MEKLDAVLSTVDELKKSLAVLAEKSGVVQADAIKKDELEKMKDDILLGVEKKLTESKMPKPSEEKKPAMKLAEFLIKAKMNHSSVSDHFLKTAMTEGTPAQGGYVVPTEYSDMILGALNNDSLVVNRFTPIIHNYGFTKQLPKWLTDLTVYWVAEASAKTVSKPTLSYSNSVLKKICAIITASDEFIQDEISGMEQHLANLVAQNIAIELERLGFIGDVSGLGDPFNGVSKSTPNSANQIGAHISYADIVALVNNASMLEIYRQGAEITCNRSMLGGIMGIVDGAGRPIWNLQLDSNGKLVNTVLGIPITLATSITNTCSTGGAKSMVFYGNPKNIMMGKKAGNEGIELLVSQHGVIGTSTISENLFQQDETAYRFVMRRSIVVPVGGAFTVIDEAVA